MNSDLNLDSNPCSIAVFVSKWYINIPPGEATQRKVAYFPLELNLHFLIDVKINS